MDFWTVASYAAWIISAAIFLWMLWDAFKVGQRFDEELLQSSPLYASLYQRRFLPGEAEAPVEVTP